MPILNQPFDGHLGELLQNQLANSEFSRFFGYVAFARNSGVLRIKPDLEKFRNHNGIVHFFVGIDMGGTTYEALVNLLSCCSSLHIIHATNPTITYHPKIYFFEGRHHSWFSIGSQNLTHSGLWTNIESCYYSPLSNTSNEYEHILDSFSNLMTRYTDTHLQISKKINSLSDLNELLEKGYIFKENSVESKQRIKQGPTPGSTQTLFGTLPTEGIPRFGDHRNQRGVIPVSNNNSVYATHIIQEHNAQELIWVETKKMTGGSSNILDLSKIGKISTGTAIGSRYETDNQTIMLGSVAFFDIDPNNISVEKAITLNFDGIDYAPCIIKYAPNNGSWRIQLRGKDKTHRYSLHRIKAQGWLVNTILVFEKINTDYYGLSVFDDSESVQNELRAQSYVVASNGIAHGSKQFGLLRPSSFS